MASELGLNMLIEERAVDRLMLCLPEDNLEMLFLGDSLEETDRFRAMYSADLLVCESARVGIVGASSSEAVFPGAVPK